MSEPGIALLGFMEEILAVEFPPKVCVVPDPTDDAALHARWASAQAALGSPVVNAGKPDVHPIPTSHHVDL